MQYDAVVPDDIEVEVVPSGAGSAWGLNMTRREAVDRARRVYLRVKRFQRARRKRIVKGSSNEDAS
jgi:hypothetical protein